MSGFRAGHPAATSVMDHGKRSKRGSLDLLKHDDESGNRTNETIRLDEVGRDGGPVRTAMHTVFQDGEIYYTGDESLERIRDRASMEFIRAAPAGAPAG